MATKERKMTDFIAYIIDELESVGYEPNTVPGTFTNQSHPENFINMIWWDENGNAESTRCLQLNIGEFRLTRDFNDAFVAKTKATHAPKMAAMSSSKRVEKEAKIAIMNKECGLVNLKRAANRYRKMLEQDEKAKKDAAIAENKENFKEIQSRANAKKTATATKHSTKRIETFGAKR